MKASRFICLFIIMALAACNQHNTQQRDTNRRNDTSFDAARANIKADTLAFVYESYRSAEGNCKENCDYAAIAYPVFKNEPALNDSINKIVLAYIGEEGDPNKDLPKLIKKWADDYMAGTDSIQDVADRPARILELNLTVNRQAPGLVEIICLDEMAGGAHPNTSLSYINWDTEKHKRIMLDDLFISGYNIKLNQIGEKRFRKYKGLKASASLDAFGFEHRGFALSDIFQITPNGLCFHYNETEIQTYEGGPVELMLPYQDIKHLLKPNSVISQYIK